MLSETVEKLISYFEEIDSLIKRGKLPHKGVFPRIAYVGHEVLEVYGNFPRKFRCVICMQDWYEAEKLCNHDSSASYIINYSPEAKWKCKACHHIWISDAGTYCSECHVPYWDC